MDEEIGEVIDLKILDQFLKESDSFEIEQVLEEWEKNQAFLKDDTNDSTSEVPTMQKLQNWSPNSQEDWPSSFPVSLKLLSQDDMEHFLKVTHACHNKEEFNNYGNNSNSGGNNFNHSNSSNNEQMPDVLSGNSLMNENFEDDKSLTDPCLFVSKDGNQVFTCSFPEFPTQRGSLIASDLDYPYYDPPSYFDVEKTTKHDPLKRPQVQPLSSEVMKGNFMPRRSDLYPHAMHYVLTGPPSDGCLPDMTLQGQPRDIYSNSNPNVPGQLIGQFQLAQSRGSVQQNLKQDSLEPSELKFSLSSEMSCKRKRTRTPSPTSGSSKQQCRPFPVSGSDNNLCPEGPGDSLVRDKPRDLLKRAQKSFTDSPATFSSDTTIETSPGDFAPSSSPEKSSVPSPGQAEEADQKSGVEWFPFRPKSWCKMLGVDRTEVLITNLQLNVDKGFNFSHVDDSFVCQRKNHFQVTITFWLTQQPKFIEADGSLVQINSFYLYFYGVKVESESHVVTIEQSESDRTKHLYHPVKINLCDVRPNAPVKAVVGRLHFGETTLNNMRKRGKPNPDQRYFRLVVSLGTDDTGPSEPRFPVVAYASEKIIVRASNPNQFENDPESLWIKGKSSDSICHYGNVGINTKSPTEALSVHGNVKITGQILEPSDVRIKTNIKEMSTKEQLRNISMINMYQYRYLPSYEEYAGLEKSNPNPGDSKPTVGVLAQQVSQILPDAVQVVGDVLLPDGNVLEGFLVVNKDRIFMEGLGAVKELCKVTDKLERRINMIEMSNKELAKLKSTSVYLSLGQKQQAESKYGREELSQKNQDLPAKTDKSKTFKPNLCAQEKMMKFFKQRWKTLAVAVAISIALVCSIIGMAFGIKSKIPPPNATTRTTTTAILEITSAPCPSLYLTCNDMGTLECSSLELAAGKTETITAKLAQEPGTCPQTAPNDPKTKSGTETTNIPAWSSAIPAVDRDSSPHQDNDTGRNTFTEQSLLSSTSAETSDLPKDNSTRRRKRRNVRSWDEKEGPVLVLSFNKQLCGQRDTEGHETTYKVLLSKDFPVVNVKVQFRTRPETDVFLCQWEKTNRGDADRTESPCSQSGVETSFWSLPVGFYHSSSFTFLLHNKPSSLLNDEEGICDKGQRHKIIFSR